jgi:hypothetical protein
VALRRLAALTAFFLLIGGALGIALATGARTPAAADAGPVLRETPAAPRPVSPAPRATAPAPPPRPAKTPAQRRLAERRRLEREIVWRRSEAVGRPDAGRLVRGVRLPREGVHFFTWDPVRWRSPSPETRRFATDRLVRTILAVAAEHRKANPRAPRLAVGDLSRPGGGSFDARYGALAEFGRGRGTLGHVSHQNGLDVDVYYPRKDRRERGPDRLEDIDLRLAQDLVDRFVAAGARYVFVGPRTGLKGPPGIVQPLVRHDDHIHVRLR